jgi:dipeptidyl aminopeptidase/acylaminoacyl peptidase
MLKLRRLSFLAGTFLSMHFVAACGGGGDGETKAANGFDFTPPTSAQLEDIQSMWRSRDLQPRDVTVFHRDDTNANYELRIYEHTVGTRRHYGAVTIPKAPPGTRFPVVLFASGLSQDNPTLDAGAWAQNASARLGQAVFVVPAFRGVTLIYKGITVSAQGDFCDAYDGAADDSIALLNVVQAEIAQADFSRVMVRGGSRGGNTALLLAVRDPRVTVAAAASAPTDFYRSEVARHYNRQYNCQFFDGKTEQESRQRMLASSPVFFPVLPNVATVYLEQGSVDDVVPPWNAEVMATAIRALTPGPTLNYRVYQGFGHDLGQSSEFRAAQAAIYDSFLAN